MEALMRDRIGQRVYWMVYKYGQRQNRVDSGTIVDRDIGSDLVAIQPDGKRRKVVTLCQSRVYLETEAQP